MGDHRLGAIGTRVAALAEAFGCRAVYYSPPGRTGIPVISGWSFQSFCGIRMWFPSTRL